MKTPVRIVLLLSLIWGLFHVSHLPAQYLAATTGIPPAIIDSDSDDDTGIRTCMPPKKECLPIGGCKDFELNCSPVHAAIRYPDASVEKCDIYCANGKTYVRICVPANMVPGPAKFFLCCSDCKVDGSNAFQDPDSPCNKLAPAVPEEVPVGMSTMDFEIRPDCCAEKGGSQLEASLNLNVVMAGKKGLSDYVTQFSFGEKDPWFEALVEHKPKLIELKGKPGKKGTYLLLTPFSLTDEPNPVAGCHAIVSNRDGELFFASKDPELPLLPIKALKVGFDFPVVGHRSGLSLRWKVGPKLSKDFGTGARVRFNRELSSHRKLSR